MKLPASHVSKPRKRTIRADGHANARELIGELTPGCELFCLTKGQTNLIDVIHTCLEQTGKAAVDLATWTAADADIRHAFTLLESSQAESMRWLIDPSFYTRKPAFCAALVATFGPDSVRTAKTHAKFVLVRNASWNLAIRTSMNLTGNPRIENFEISDDPALAGFLGSVMDDIFSSSKAPNFTNHSRTVLDALPMSHGQLARSANGVFPKLPY